MTIKTCKCGFVGDESLFRKNRPQCKTCSSKVRATYRDKNKHKLKLKEIEYRNTHDDKVKQNKKAYRKENKLKLSIKDKAYFEKNKEEILIKRLERRAKNPTKEREWQLKSKSMKGMPEELIKTQALVNYIKHELRKEK